MRKLLILVIGVAVGAGGILLAQQKYPNVPDVPVLLENDKVVVQRLDFQPGSWVGEHTHPGNQLVVLLTASTTVYKEGGKERTVNYDAGDVFWIDEVTHDHRADAEGAGILITFK